MPSRVDVVELHFEPTGGSGAVPEIELWGVADAPRPRIPKLSAEDLPEPLVATKVLARVEIEPGSCAAFSVTLTRRPELFRRAFITYQASDVLRGFGIKRSLNGLGEHGGSWLPGAGTTEVIDEIDPQSLRPEANEVSLCVPDDAARRTTIERLRIIGELDMGNALARTISIGSDLRDGAVLHDADLATSLELAAGARVLVTLDRLIAPDALLLSGQIRGTVSVTCIERSGAAAPLDVRQDGGAFMLDGGARRCAQLAISVDQASTLAELDVIGSGAAERVDWPRLVVTSAREHFGDVAWVGGFVARPRAMTTAIRVRFADEDVGTRTGDFGRMVKRGSDAPASWRVPVTAAFPDGTSETLEVLLERDRRQDLVSARASTAEPSDVSANTRLQQLGQPGAVAVARASRLVATQLRLGTRVGVDIPAGAVDEPTDITVRHLGRAAVPALDPGMINVTGPEDHAYELLPHGQRFARPVEVVLPYDPALLPEGMTPDDVYIYSFDLKAQRWGKLPRRSIDLGERITRSSADHFTIMINAVLAVPRNPTPLAHDPTALTSIGAASPASNIDFIEPPAPSPTGDAHVSLPVRLPQGRGAYSPSLEISYSSAGGNGWLGVGWELPLSRIEIDTRWGVPTYTAAEHVRYLLDGAELVPTTEHDGPGCTAGGPGQRFRLRVEGSFAHVLRCGSDPASYHFELRDREGTLFRYGGAGATLASYTNGGVFRFALREVVDTHGNTTRFFYTTDAESGPGEPFRELYPSRIEYTSHASLPAAYAVHFDLDDGGRPDRIVSGRAGFKTVTRKLLRSIRVTFQGGLVRQYVLTYGHGEFDKTVLSSIRVYGTHGCAAGGDAFTTPSCAPSSLFHEHRFDYHFEEQAFSAIEQWSIADDPEPARATLAKGATSGGGFNISLSAELPGGVSATAGANVGGSTRHESVGMYDMNSDGLPDQVFEVDGQTVVLYNRSRPAGVPTSEPLFAAATDETTDLADLGIERNSDWGVSLGLEASLGGFAASAGAGFSSSTARSRQLLTDLDGDGYTDVVHAGGQALRGQPCAAGTGTCFVPAQFGAAGSIDPRKDPMLAALAADIAARTFTGDPVVRWVAPFTGTITVRGTVQKAHAGGADGVGVEVYHQDALVEGVTIAPAATAMFTFPSPRSIHVVAGDALYLRVQTNEDDAVAPDGTLVDAVDARLEIAYSRACTPLGCDDIADPDAARDPTDRPVFAFATDTDLRVAGAPAPLVVPARGTLDLHLNAVKRPSVADVRLCVQRFAAPGGTMQLSLDRPCHASDAEVANVSGTVVLAAAASTTTPIDLTALQVEPGQVFMIRAESDLSFDPADVFIESRAPETPLAAYSEVCLPNLEGTGFECSSDARVFASVPLDTRRFGMFTPIANVQPAIPYVAADTGTLEVDSFPAPVTVLGLDEPFLVAARSNRRGILWAQDCTHASCAAMVDVPSLAVEAGESITFELATPSGDDGGWLTATLDGDASSIPLQARELGASATAGSPFHGGYRGLSVGVWNDREAFAPAQLLDDLGQLAILAEDRRKQIARSMVAPEAFLRGAEVTGGVPAWIAPSSHALVSATLLHAAPIGIVEQTGQRGGLFAADYLRISGTRSFFLTAKAELERLHVASVGLQGSASRTDTTTDIVDMNGDGIADVLTPAGVTLGAFTAATAGGGVAAFDAAGLPLRRRDGHEYAIDFGGRAVIKKTRASGLPVSVDNDKGPDRGFLGLSAGLGLGIGRTQLTRDLVDVNGDGLPDLVSRDATGIEVQYNLGDRYGRPEPFGTVAAPLLDPLDGFEELVEGLALGFDLDSTRHALQHETTLNVHASGGFKLGSFLDLSSSVRASTTRITRQLADINGDGLPDLLFKKHGEPRIRVQLNRGGDLGPATDWTIPAGWPESPGGVFASASSLPSKVASWLDKLLVTGPDVLAGTGSQDGSSKSASAAIPLPYVTLGLGGSRSTSKDTYELSLLDIDGDGAADHVLRVGSSSGTGRIYVKRNRVTGKTNLLRAIHRPLGGRITLSYNRVGNTVALPQSRQVLTRVEVDDGVDLGSAFPSPNLVTTIQYENGFYHRREKEFFGFGKITARRADGVTTELEYENGGYALKGLQRSETRRDSLGRLLRRRVIQRELRPVLDADGQPVGPDAGCLGHLHPSLDADACTPRFAVVTQEDDLRAEGGSVTKTRRMKDLAHDRFGHVLESIDYADDAITNDDLYTSAAYSNDTTRWILGRPTSLTARAGSASGALLRSRSGTYNAQGAPLAIAVATGAGTAVTQLAYDDFGNLAHVTTPPNHVNQVQTFSLDYDDPTRTYPTRATDGFGYTSHAAYDPRFGVATSEIDVNGAQVRRTLDPFGRLLAVHGPYDAIVPALSFEYLSEASPPRAVTITRASAPADYSGPVPAPITTVTVTDGLARALQLRKTAVVDGITGMTTSGGASYDAIGRVTATYHPFFTPGASTGFVAPVVTPATRVAYDALDRTVSTRQPDGATETARYDLAAPPDSPGTVLFAITAVDANGHVRETFADHLERVRTFVEHPTATTSSINRYDYLPTGELSRIVDAEGAQTRLGYDLRGLRTSFDNPDYGLIEERHDLMGNRIALIEPNHRALGAEVRYLYDRDRLSRIDYPSKPDVTFVYGAPGAGAFRAGRLAEVHDETGSQEHFYGALGESRRTLRTVRDPAHPSHAPKVFDTRFTSDSLGRMLRIGYPDGEQVTHTYDAGGSLAKVTGHGAGYAVTYADELRYDVFGNRTRARFGNGVVTTWSFDPLRVRLASLVTTLPAPAATKVQDLRYSYDPADNPTQIEDALPPPPASGKLPGGSSVAFTYDGVDRLTRAVGKAPLAQGSSTTYDQTFAYSASHNLLSKQRVHLLINNGGNAQSPTATNFAAAYTYGAARPHLPSRVGDLDLAYDPSGNPITRRSAATGSIQQLTWDDDGRLVQVSGMGANQRNVYDASGLRVIRSGQDGDTVFASPYFDVANDNTGTKHVFAGALRVASVLRAYSSGSDPPLPPSSGTAFYFHADHLGSTGVVTAQDGTVNDAHAYFPDGELWIDAGPKQPINGYLFSGKQLDVETGFYDFGQRFYDPRLSLWLGTDPILLDDAPDRAIGQPLLLAPGAYAAHNPLGFIDPDGRDWVSWLKRGGRAVGRFVRDEVAPRAAGAVKIWAGTAGFVAGAALCDTGLGCVAGGPLMAMSADVGASGVSQVIDGSPHATVAGQLGGPTAQAIEEGIVGAAGIVGTVRALSTRGTSRALSESGNGTTGSSIQATTTRSVAHSGASVVRAGQAGEAAVRSVANIGPKVSIRVAGRTRIPDGLTSSVLSEVKNVSSLSYTQQLRDFATYARQNGLRFDLWVRPTTQLSAPLAREISSGTINLRYIP
ncbi:MAG TPA: toxin TcdB middle/N-terminal domain-containing protein [Kofleriaceae bacterium]|nr:toxin TcdB middle/N-terminal domain-containing protein [Kofleriaceae bacterium]